MYISGRYVLFNSVLRAAILEKKEVILMGFKKSFAQFLSDETGQADHRSLLRWGALEAQADAAGTKCPGAGRNCTSAETCCSVPHPGKNYCSVSCS